jgi:hypothetical protein
MGRFAYFNTGFEYEFVHGVQENGDILGYGGTPEYTQTFCGQIDAGKISWSSSDKEYILSELATFNNPLPEFDTYEKNVNGTLRLYKTLLKKSYVCVDHSYEKACFTLGCLIYHQLLYKPDLGAVYEEH